MHGTAICTRATCDLPVIDLIVICWHPGRIPGETRSPPAGQAASGRPGGARRPIGPARLLRCSSDAPPIPRGNRPAGRARYACDSETCESLAMPQAHGQPVGVGRDERGRLPLVMSRQWPGMSGTAHADSYGRLAGRGPDAGVSRAGRPRHSAGRGVLVWAQGSRAMGGKRFPSERAGRPFQFRAPVRRKRGKERTERDTKRECKERGRAPSRKRPAPPRKRAAARPQRGVEAVGSGTESGGPFARAIHERLARSGDGAALGHWGGAR